QGRDVVPLGAGLVADVPGRVAGQTAEVGGDGEQFAAHGVAVGAVQQGDGTLAQAGVHHGGAVGATAVLGVAAAGVLGGLVQFSDVGGTYPAGSRMWVLGGGTGVGRLDQPPSGGHGEGRSGEGQAVELAAVHPVSPDPPGGGCVDGRSEEHTSEL